MPFFVRVTLAVKYTESCSILGPFLPWCKVSFTPGNILHVPQTTFGEYWILEILWGHLVFRAWVKKTDADLEAAAKVISLLNKSFLHFRRQNRQNTYFFRDPFRHPSSQFLSSSAMNVLTDIKKFQNHTLISLLFLLYAKEFVIWNVFIDLYFVYCISRMKLILKT